MSPSYSLTGARRLLLAFCIPALYLAAQTPSLTGLYSFTGQDGDGAYPYAAVVLGSSSVLYGTTGYGGIYGDGTVFKLTPPAGGGAWTETVLHSFTGGDGSFPYAGLVANSKGVLFGTTTFGGAFGQGVVFELSPPPAGGAWTETVLHSFSGNDGAYPFAGLALASSGTLYGTTELGGTSGAGTVFKLTPPSGSGKTWTETVLYNFMDAGDGGFPYGGLLQASNGTLYGTTNFGGADGTYGTVFELTPPAGGSGPWTETTLYSFTGTGGGNPFGTLTMGSNGNLYGTTAGGIGAGSGTVFVLQPPAAPGGAWTQNNLYTFMGTSDGDHPRCSVVVTKSGTLFGTTVAGGTGQAYLGYGTLFELTPGAPGSAWNETVLYTFTGAADGAYPNSSLVAASNGTYYGTTLAGGSTGKGTVFNLTP